jgi:hypothetical protein
MTTGSSNVFADLGFDDADALQMGAVSSWSRRSGGASVWLWKPRTFLQGSTTKPERAGARQGE